MTNQEIKQFIASYDENKDGRLSYKEFEKIVLPATDYSLKSRALDRPEEYVSIRDKLYGEIEFNLSRLIRDEIDGLKILNYKR